MPIISAFIIYIKISLFRVNLFEIRMPMLITNSRSLSVYLLGILEHNIYYSSLNLISTPTFHQIAPTKTQ